MAERFASLILVAASCFLAAKATSQEEISSVGTQDELHDLAVLRARWTPELIEVVTSALQAGEAPPVPEVTPETVARTEGNVDFLAEMDLEYRFYDLRGIDLSNAELPGVDLSYCYLQGATLKAADFSGSTLVHTHLEDADLRHATLRNSNLTGAILTSANASHANLVGSDLSESRLAQVSFVEANLSNAILRRARFLDLNLSILALALGGHERPHAAADLSRANLSHSDLQGAVLWGVALTDANLFGAVLGDTPISPIKLEEAASFRYVQQGSAETRSPVKSSWDRAVVANLHREARNFFKRQEMHDVALNYRYWQSKTATETLPWYRRWARVALLEWTYGYGARPLRLPAVAIGTVGLFSVAYLTLTIVGRGRSGLYHVNESNPGVEQRLDWRQGRIVIDCLYFSLLSLATFGYGAFRPRQWLEFFRLEPTELRAKGWARILVGCESAIGIYLFALLTVVLFGRW